MKLSVFVERLYKLMKEHNMSQKELAEKISATEASISRYLSQERTPRIDIIAKIAKELGTTADYLIGNTDDKKSVFDFSKIQRILTRNASKMTTEQKKTLIKAILDEIEEEDSEVSKID